MNEIQNKKRKSIRLESYDYSLAGAYFFTTNILRKEIILGEIRDGTIKLSKEGYIVRDIWQGLPSHFEQISLWPFCIMPDHFHGIVITVDEGKNAGSENNRESLFDVIRRFKSLTARRINIDLNTRGNAVWQKNYYEHIIRNEMDFIRITEYILANPINWEKGMRKKSSSLFA